MIRVEDYNSQWPFWFQQIHSEIWPSVKEHALSVEHVGSTSVAGLAATPIIDMDIIVESPEKLPFVIQALSKLGYVHRGNLGIEGREAFRSPGHAYKHNLYVCINDCMALRNHLALRDHLRSSESARSEYSALKKKLAAEYPESIDDYVEGKTQFILKVISQYNLSEEELTSIQEANKAPSGKVPR